MILYELIDPRGRLNQATGDSISKKGWQGLTEAEANTIFGDFVLVGLWQRDSQVPGQYSLTELGRTVALRLQDPPAVKIKTRIERVTPIHANFTQTIAIYGQGFGGHPEEFPVADDGIDTVGDSYKTSMAILNLGKGCHRWSAGRKTKTNTCAIGVRLREWTDTRIVLAGFTGPIGTSTNDRFQISEGDRLKIVVFGPSNRCGPGGLPECPDEVSQGRVAVFDTVVRPPIAEDDSWQ